MNAPARVFEIKPAIRERVPLLVGLMGPPGAGKTYSALLLAEGMRTVGGGAPVLIDTECGRSKKYADLFKFDRIDFPAPFHPRDFLAAIEAAAKSNPSAIIIDSMSDEHEGEGGVLDWHDQELDRMAGNDWAKRERVGMAAWIKPKADRRSMINGILQIQTPMIFCFRAREKVKQIKNDRGKMEPTNIGYQPIAPTDIVFAMDVNCVLPPKSDGVPAWRSDKMGEDFIIKLPEFFKAIFTEGAPITKETGRALASWAKGSPSQPPTGRTATAARSSIGSGDRAASEDESDRLERLDGELAEAATRGMQQLQQVWMAIQPADRKMLKAALDKRHKPAAERSDNGHDPDTGEVTDDQTDPSTAADSPPAAARAPSPEPTAHVPPRARVGEGEPGDIPPTDRLKRAPAEPRTASQYEAYAQAWIANLIDPESTRWVDEINLRNGVSLLPEIRERIKAQFEAKIAQLRGAAQ